VEASSFDAPRRPGMVAHQDSNAAISTGASVLVEMASDERDARERERRGRGDNALQRRQEGREGREVAAGALVVVRCRRARCGSLLLPSPLVGAAPTVAAVVGCGREGSGLRFSWGAVGRSEPRCSPAGVWGVGVRRAMRRPGGVGPGGGGINHSAARGVTSAIGD
jgi:hypothetical protein